ncbi:hypothetical protein CCMSSC00406_0002736 [Pleurotus cornucopiae]|uniref:Uncharacterized protein n=1 Tax=Pleurotus cornucopiae TaxID=5321 RepID=A0ACB7IX10_PLECO|nr:hypothetical protein CCMSSC00406_0002736 [Pleurotus cornucopiae]
MSVASPPTTLTPKDVEIATRAANHFTRVYYATYDSDSRVADLPLFYRPTSSLTWNGKPYQGADGLRALVENMPPTKHEVNSFDCHPIPGTSPPSLLVTVSGNVTHGQGPAGNPPDTPVKSPDGQPRVFSQTFMLVPDPNAPPSKAGEVAKYYVGADSLRFVG